MKKYIIFIIILLIFLYASNNWIVKSYHTFSTGKKLDGPLRIIHLSDLHNKTFAFEQSSLIKAIEEEAPDIIVMTGDILDSRKPNPSTVYKLIEALTEDYDLYYVTGNHEARLGNYQSFEQNLRDMGVKVINNASIQLNDHIQLSGLHDLAFFKSYEDYLSTMSNLVSNNDYTILLSHRPDLLEYYSDAGFDLVLSGHAHGGQFRLPKLGGLFAPNQGLFPEYTAGLHTMKQTNMIVSRGLGNSVIPIRIFNQPELVIIDLE